MPLTKPIDLADIYHSEDLRTAFVSVLGKHGFVQEGDVVRYVITPDLASRAKSASLALKDLITIHDGLLDNAPPRPRVRSMITKTQKLIIILWQIRTTALNIISRNERRDYERNPATGAQ